MYTTYSASIGDGEESGASTAHAIAAIGRTEIIIFLGSTEVWVVDISWLFSEGGRKRRKRRKRKEGEGKKESYPVS
ncbi:hypothetical protein LX32DRAFT_644458 [Colletotrichum zoysiae]|uniref:Uncharacterized protein n=1 Tax=Colletotrichum zoysiae TaxID=1216348 RepID=A0AAD9H7C7_9PEZI|nr:hypothetical protein LX32DRAFT_644458 [Colletotrichum zoysiae]